MTVQSPGDLLSSGEVVAAAAMRRRVSSSSVISIEIHPMFWSYLGTAARPAEFRVDRKTVARWAADGKIDSIRTAGGHHRFRRADVDALLHGYVAPADAVAAAVSAERARILEACERLKEPHRQPGTGTPEYAVPLSLLRVELGGAAG